MQRRVALTVVVAAFALAAGQPAGAGSIEAGKTKVKTKGCVTCHGKDGQGTMPMYPNLAGQKEAYLERQLKAFRSGKRKAQRMSVVADGLSNKDIADLAAYYASRDPCNP